MGQHKEFFKKLHPEQFSDSKIVKKGKLDRNILDFYLETLTSKGLDKEFEGFCRHIAEVEICPNLLPQTGPTGGGDSKVDSETYPVAEKISCYWYYGEGNKASTERWAFAISAKKDWKPKVKSDIGKIAKVNEEVGRGYTKAFFMSNQYISDKKRADTEDELRNLYGIDVRILDRTWLLDKALKSAKNIGITIECFGFSDSFVDEIQVGENDYRRKVEYEENENKLLSDDIKPAEKVELSRKNLILARELEFSKEQILGLIERNNGIASKYGMNVDIADAFYDAAWTIYWWYPDSEIFYDYYKKYEEIALAESNVNFFNNLLVLWTNLYSLSCEDDKILIENHTNKIKEKYNYFISDSSKPNTAIEAKASYQMIRIFLGDDINDIVDDMIQIVNDSQGHLDLNLYSLSQVIQKIPLFEEAERYDELFERTVSVMSEQTQKSEAALMLAKRGHSLKARKPYEALSYFSRTLMSLYNEKNKSHLITVILKMGDIFQEVGLLWAARNFYYYDFCLCLNQYMKFGEVHPAMFLSAHFLKYIELKLGHVLYAVYFDELENIAQQLYPDKIDSDTENDNFDYILAIQILRTSFEVEKQLGQVPAYLERQGLLFSSAAAKYELGYYDDKILSELDGNEEAFDDLIGKWRQQPALEQLNAYPWYGIEPICIMKTNLLGCSIELSCVAPYEHGEIEIGATILSTIESFYGTGVSKGLFSLVGNVKIELHFDIESEVLIKAQILETKPNVINVTFKEYDSKNIISAQKDFSDFLVELIGMITAIMFSYESGLEKVEEMVKNDAAFERSQTFANSVFYGMETLGKNTFCFSSVIHDLEDLKMKRTCKSEVTENEVVEEKVSSITPKTIMENELPEDIDLKNVSNANIFTSTIINVPLWNVCEWKGVLFLTDLLHRFPPVLSFAFMKSTCKNIFEDWINDFGHQDSQDKIGIRIIKGIDKNHPYWYRVIVGPLNLQHRDNMQIITMPTRVHTMEPNNEKNLKMFEQELHLQKCFSICPSYFYSMSSNPQVFQELMIHKKIESIIICDACDVSETDMLMYTGILPTDNPIIPAGKENAPILSIIDKKRRCSLN